jgi:hypothetical protein
VTSEEVQEQASRPETSPRRPWVGVISYLVASVVKALVPPWRGLGTFFLLIVYQAWTSEGLRELKASNGLARCTQLSTPPPE